MRDYTTLADPDDICRACRGTGRVRDFEPDGMIHDRRCDRCGGHGRKTAVIEEHKP